MEKYTEPVNQGFVQIARYKLIVLISCFVGFVVYKMITGQIQFTNNIEIDTIKDYKFTLQELFERLNKIKNYLFTIIIMGVIVYFLSKSNQKWETEYLKKLREQENEDSDSSDDNLKNGDSLTTEKKVKRSVYSPHKKGRKKLSVVKEEAEGDDDSVVNKKIN